VFNRCFIRGCPSYPASHGLAVGKEIDGRLRAGWKVTRIARNAGRSKCRLSLRADDQVWTNAEEFEVFGRLPR